MEEVLFNKLSPKTYSILLSQSYTHFMTQRACVVVKWGYKGVNPPMKYNDVAQRGGSSHFSVTEQF